MLCIAARVLCSSPCRLWHISRKECLCCFQHVDFVTAIAFHPRVSSVCVEGEVGRREGGGEGEERRRSGGGKAEKGGGS